MIKESTIQGKLESKGAIVQESGKKENKKEKIQRQESKNKK